jgi:hypothetical protein
MESMTGTCTLGVVNGFCPTEPPLWLRQLDFQPPPRWTANKLENLRDHNESNDGPT